MISLLSNIKIVRVKNAVVAGTSVQTATTVDMQGYDGALCIAALGALSATQVTALKAQQGSDSGGSGAADITGAITTAAADADSNKLLVLDVVKPASRYVTFVLNRATGNAVLDSMIVILYGSRSVPVTADTSVSQQLAIAPAS